METLTDTESISGLMGELTKETEWTTEWREEAVSSTKTEGRITENLQMGYKTDKESFYDPMVGGMKGIG